MSFDDDLDGRFDDEFDRGLDGGHGDGPSDDEFDRGLDGDPDGRSEARDGIRWPLDWRGLYPRERWLWFEQLWVDVCLLRDRYGLAVRAGWWRDAIQVEALSALAAWTERYDSGEWDDPPGKLALLFDLERVGALLRDGGEPFHPDRDRDAFLLYLIEIGAQPPPTVPRGRER